MGRDFVATFLRGPRDKSTLPKFIGVLFCYLYRTHKKTVPTSIGTLISEITLDFILFSGFSRDVFPSFYPFGRSDKLCTSF